MKEVTTALSNVHVVDHAHVNSNERKNFLEHHAQIMALESLHQQKVSTLMGQLAELINIQVTSLRESYKNLRQRLEEQEALVNYYKQITDKCNIFVRQ